MGNLIASLRHLGSSFAEGVSRGIASFSERIERNAIAFRQARRSAPHAGPGERVMSSMLRTSGMNWAGYWSSNRQLQVQFYRRWVYVAISRICWKIASLQPRVALVHAQGVGGGGRNQRRAMHSAILRQKRYQKSLNALKPHEEIEDVGADHPLVRLLARPNAWDRSPGQLFFELVLFMELTGNGYLWVVPSQVGTPCELWVIPSHWVQPVIGPAGIEYYRITAFAGGAGVIKLPADEVIYFPYKNPTHKLDGMAPLAAGAEWVDVAESIDQSRYWQFKNGCMANGALELGPKYDVDDADIEAVGAKFYARYQGERNSGAPIILPPDIKYTPLTISPTEMAYQQSAEQMMNWILALHGVPKEVAGIQDAGSEIAMWGPLTQFCEHAVSPKLRLIGEVLTASLCPRWDEHLRLWWDDPVPENPDQVNKDMQVNYANGLQSINEGRAIRGLEPVDNPLADEPMVNPNLIPISMLQKKLEQDVQQAQQQQQQPMPGMPGAAAQPGGEEQPAAPPEAEKPEAPALAKRLHADLLKGWAARGGLQYRSNGVAHGSNGHV